MLQERTSPYMIIFTDDNGDGPLGGGSTLVLGYEYTDGTHGSQIAIKFNRLEKRGKIENAWSEWSNL